MKFSVLVEWLPKIRACNFIIKTADCSQDSSVTIKTSNVLINVPAMGCLEFRFSSTGVTLVPDSLSGLFNNNNSIIFRARIDDFNGSIQKNGPTQSVNYKINEDTVVFCAACKHQVSKTLRMSRALPLPTNGEMDFFCHQHSGHKLSSLNPGLTDIFYDHLYFLIHTDHLLQGSDAAKFECFNCSTTLGKIEKKAVKIWNSDAFIQNSVYDPHKCVPRYHQFLSGLFNLTEDVPAQMNKFVFICDGDRANETYTRMWVLDRSLMLSECESDSREVDLNCKIVKKVLYSHHAELSSEVDDFIKSPTALSISLSPSGQEILLKVLSFMSRNIPVEFSIVNGMKVSYLMFDDDINWDDL